MVENTTPYSPYSATGTTIDRNLVISSVVDELVDPIILGESDVFTTMLEFFNS